MAITSKQRATPASTALRRAAALSGALPGGHRDRHGLQRELGPGHEKVRLGLLLPEEAGGVRAGRHLRAGAVPARALSGLPAARLSPGGARAGLARGRAAVAVRCHGRRREPLAAPGAGAVSAVRIRAPGAHRLHGLLDGEKSRPDQGFLDRVHAACGGDGPVGRFDSAAAGLRVGRHPGLPRPG